jgi:hypothetical protein
MDWILLPRILSKQAEDVEIPGGGRKPYNTIADCAKRDEGTEPQRLGIY